MKFQFHWPSVGLEVGTLTSDEISDAIHKAGIREVARRSGLSPTTVSMWASGKFKLPWDSAMAIVQAVDLEEDMWLATLYERMAAAEKLGWTFHPEDAKTRKEREE